MKHDKLNCSRNEAIKEESLFDIFHLHVNIKQLALYIFLYHFYSQSFPTGFVIQSSLDVNIRKRLRLSGAHNKNWQTLSDNTILRGKRKFIA